MLGKIDALEDDLRANPLNYYEYKQWQKYNDPDNYYERKGAMRDGDLTDPNYLDSVSYTHLTLPTNREV